MSDDQCIHVAQAARWESVQTWRDYGEATAAWLLGEIQYHPTYGDPAPDAETLKRADVLAEMNRLGFVTSDSQEGFTAAGDPWAQRAYIEGCCDDETAELLMASLNSTDLVSLWATPGESGKSQIVVTREGRRENTWLGWLGADSASVEQLREHAGDGVANLFADAWHLQIFDPVWGRDDLLWTEVLEALRNGRSNRD